MLRPTGPGKVKVESAGGTAKVAARIYNFDVDGDALKAEHKEWLDRNVIPGLLADRSSKVSLHGTASQSGSSGHNRQLSERRVNAVRDYLVGKGVALSQIDTSHSGEDLSTSKAKEDELERAVFLVSDLRVFIDRVLLMRDSYTAPLSWDEIIGLDTTTINIQIAASGADEASMPDAIEVRIVSEPPNKETGVTTVSRALTARVPRHGVDPADPSRTLYRLTQHIASVGPFAEVEAGKTLEVATIVRDGGTSDAEFRKALGVDWNTRGIAVQPTSSPSDSTGSELKRAPDALKLLKAGGVEVLKVAVAPGGSRVIRSGSSVRLIRSPADILYYSGHGLSELNCLAIEISPLLHRCWARASDLIPHWKHPMDLDVFIIAGCSVLKIDFGTTPPTGPGLEWAELLNTKRGPLTTLLGYSGSAPLDSSAGNAIAAEMGKRIAGGSRKFVEDWLNINGDKRAWNAVAIDRKGYWSLDPTEIFGRRPGPFSIKGPQPIP